MAYGLVVLYNFNEVIGRLSGRSIITKPDSKSEKCVCPANDVQYSAIYAYYLHVQMYIIYGK